MKLQSLKRAYKDGLIMRKLLHRLEKSGLIIEFYYVHVARKSDVREADRSRKPKLDEYAAGFLDKEDMSELASCEAWLSEEMLLDRLRRGIKCFAVKHQGRIISYMWCAFEEINDRCVHLKLKPDEAHIHNVYTLPEYRGKGLAPFMRTQCYEALGKAGIERFYSHCDAFNTPSVRYKEKMNTPVQKLGLFISLGGKYSRNWTLKEYDIP